MQNSQKKTVRIFQKQVALPADHGSWVFLLSPFLIGLFASGGWSPNVFVLLAGLISIFFIRQPAAIIIKAISGRRSKRILPAAYFWLVVYSIAGAASMAALIFLGYGQLIWLGIPGIAVFSWHLWLVRRRQERHQMGVDILASGVLALSAPAAYWVNLGDNSLIGWELWLLTWLQSAASIVYAFLRLEQRSLEKIPIKSEQFIMGRRALAYSGFNLLLSLAFTSMIEDKPFIWMPYLLQFTETVWGVFNPAVGKKPTAIGVRQLLVSTLFTVVFIITW